MAAKKNLLLERLYGAGETRPFAGLTQNQSALRANETEAARAHMARAGVKNTVFMSDQEVRSAYYSKPKTHWDAEEERHTGSEYRYYSMHPANADAFRDDLLRHRVQFNSKPKTTVASKHGVKIGGSYNYDNDRHDTHAHPRLEFAVKASPAFHDSMLEKHGQHLVYEGKAWSSFFKEALDSVTVAGVDGIPRTSPVKNEDDQLDNNDPAIYNGLLPDAADTLGKIFDAETQARLRARYGDKWVELVAHELATIPRMQPNNRDLNESWKGLALAAAVGATGIGGGIALGHHIGNQVADQPAYTPEPFVPTHRIIHNGEGVQVISRNDTHSTVRRWDGRSRRTTAIPNDELVSIHEELRAAGRDLADKMLDEDYVPLTEELAAALNLVNTVDHGNTKPPMKSTMAWIDGVEHLYGPDVAKQANDIIDSHGHAAALDFVRTRAKDRNAAGNGYPNDRFSRLDNGPYSQLHAIHLAEDFRPGLLNPGGMFGRQPDEVYTKHHGNFSTDYHRVGPYGKDAAGVPEDLLYTDPHVKTLTTHLDGLKAAGKIQGYKWEHYVDDDSRSKARLKVTATHAMQKSLDGGEHSLNSALHAASQNTYGRRDEFIKNRLDADRVPNSPNIKPMTVTDQDREVHRILQSNPEATDEEVGKAWDSHVAAGTVKSYEVPNLVRRYRSRVAYHQGKGNLAE